MGDKSKVLVIRIADSSRSQMAEGFLRPRAGEDRALATALKPSAARVMAEIAIGSYTVGQRKMLGIASTAPLYVLSVEISSRTVIVGTREELRQQGMTIGSLNWIAFDSPPQRFQALARIRHRQPVLPATVSLRDDGYADVWFSQPQMGIAPGQSAVFYDGDSVIGSGVIARPS